MGFITGLWSCVMPGCGSYSKQQCVKASFNQEKFAARVDAQYIYRHTDPVRMRNN